MNLCSRILRQSTKKTCKAPGRGKTLLGVVAVLGKETGNGEK